MDNKKKLHIELKKLWLEAAFKKWGDKCLCCNEKAVAMHHYIPKSKSFGLKYNVMNAIPMCQKHHYLIHFSHNPDVQRILCDTIIEKRGQLWYTYIQDNKAGGKDTVWWLEEQKEKLLTYLGR